MKTRKELTCIGCPMGCLVTIELEDGAIGEITGNSCPHGREYAVKELTHPERTLTSTVPVDGGKLCMVPVKTAGDIPKDKIFEAMAQVHALRLKAPVEAGKVVLKDIAGTGISLITTRAVGSVAGME
ncbi:MAG: DUF1667 domain-containing protein [Oscillospiraceae bacterium]|nr:DUF1667 domain-containing protein [Oscillospiraceae bacterium]